MTKIKIFIILVLLPAISFAADSSLGGQLDELVTLFQTTSAGWVNPMQSVAFQIFSIIFLPETVWILIKNFLENNYGKMWTMLGLRIVTAGFYLYWIQHPQIFYGIVQFFAQAGGKASGFTFTPDGAFSLKPSTIINYYQVVDDVVSKALDTSGISDLGLIILIVVQEIVIEGALILIALILTVTLLEAYIVTCGGIALLGFAGSSWTIGYFQAYLKYTIGVAVKFMVICLLMGMFQKILSTQILQFTSVCSGGVCPIKSVAHIFGQTMVLVVVITYLAYKVPEIASSMLSGTLNMNFAGLATAAAGIMTTGKASGGMAMGAAGATGKIISAGAAIATGKGAGDLIKGGMDKLRGGGSSGGITDSSLGSIGAGGNSQTGRFQTAGQKLKEAGGYAKSSFGQMANAAGHGKNMSQSLSGSSVHTGAGPNIGHTK